MMVGMMLLLVVALRKESVDRNVVLYRISSCGRVALRKESVDRNVLLDNGSHEGRKSLSARRAWIEIGTLTES